jgi:hypothetical protein
MANQADLDKALEDHRVYFIANELHIHDRVCHRRILNRGVGSDVKAVELNHFFKAPYSHFPIGRGRDKICVLVLNRS